MSSGENPPPRGIPRPLSGGPVKFGPYWLDARLAVGGTAEVYVARPRDANAEPKKLIVKRLLPHFVADADGRTMFAREAALHAAVRHENVVRVFASGIEGEEPWLAMELVDGCDLYRLLRRLSSGGRKLPTGVAVHVACAILSALDSVHSAKDEAGQPMAIVHRDVTPSNVYLARTGAVKLGDFGIARSASRATLRSGGSAMLKGKFAYLSPEQVAGEGFDHRADLFAAAVVVSEMLLGKPLFAGSGQLAVLLAIRDCRIEPLREAKGGLPKGLFEALERALSRDPARRFPSAAALREALAPFDTAPAAAQNELGALVRWVQLAPSTDHMIAVRETAGQIRATVAARTGSQGEAPASQDITGEYAPIPSFVVTQGSERLGPWTFARLVEGIATGEVRRGDMVDYMGRGLAPIESVDELARFLPAATATTSRIGDVGAADFVDEVSTAALVAVLLRVLATDATGVLFAEGQTESRRGSRATGLEGGRKELYFVDGRLHHVASNNASELLGEFLARRGVISREELDFALAVLPRYDGRMGDTLISLGLVSSLDVFRAIRDQGRDRLIDLFTWPMGRLSYYAGQAPPHVEFPLDLDLPALVVAGLEAAQPGDLPLEVWRSRLDLVVERGAPKSRKLGIDAWPESTRGVLELVEHAPKGLRVRDLITKVGVDGKTRPSDALRSLELLVAAGLVVVA